MMSAMRAPLASCIFAFAAALTLSAAPDASGQTAAVVAPPAASGVELTLIGPKEERSSTPREFVNVIGRTSREATVTVAGTAASVFPTGIFVRDRVPLVMGNNTIRIEASLPNGEKATRTIEVERVTPPPPEELPTDRLFIDVKSIQPQAALRVAPGEPIEVSLRATPGMVAEARLARGEWQRLGEETEAGSSRPTGKYVGYLAIAERDYSSVQPVQIRLEAAKGAKVEGRRRIEAKSTGDVGVWTTDSVRLFVVSEAGADMTWGIHDVRLGGPNLAELTGGTVLRATGQRGDFLRVRLAPDTEGWVSARAVTPAPPGTPVPYLVFTSLSVTGDDSGDTVVIPYTSPVPYAVRSSDEAGEQAAIDVDLYGAHNASTWVTQRASASVVRDVSVEQPAAGRIRVRIVLNERQLWGYKAEQTRAALRITIRKRPPKPDAPASPLRGLTIAVEAGHGGQNNQGARGFTGAMEKDINRLTVEALEAELVRAGARVVIVRPGDENPDMAERVRRVTASDANLFISVHANSADTANGYLRNSGTSTYYKHAFCRELSTAVHRQLLARTGLADFGNVGAFNYTPTRRVTWMPSMLVEQAFMSNPSDESQMLDPAFRAKTALAIRLGIEDFLASR